MTTMNDDYQGLNYKSFGLEVKAVSSEGEFEGHAAAFNNMDHGMDVILPGAFKASLIGFKDSGRLPPLLFGHNMRDLPIGKFKEMREDDKGLFVKGQLVLDVQKAREVHALMKADALSGMSIGFRVKDQDFTEAGVRILKEIELFEASVLPLPMNDEARVTAVKSFTSGKVPDKRVLEHALRDVGMSQRQAKALLGGGYEALRDVGSGDLESVHDSLNKLRGVLNGI